METKTNPFVEIIVVTYNTPELEEACLKSIGDNTDNNYKLTVIDNYPLKRNLASLWNETIEASEADYICLLNPDTEVTPGWLSRMLEVFSVSPLIKIVGPSTNQCGSIQMFSEHKERIKASGANYFLDVLLSGFCMLFSKNTWRRLSGFDESYPLYGQDTDFVARCLLVGFHTAWAVDAFVKHHGSATVKKAAEAGELDEKAEREKGMAHFKSKIPTEKLAKVAKG